MHLYSKITMHIKRELLRDIDMCRQVQLSKRWCMGVKAENRGQMRCDITVQVASTLIAWSYSRKLTLKLVITGVGLVYFKLE